MAESRQPHLNITSSQHCCTDSTINTICYFILIGLSISDILAKILFPEKWKQGWKMKTRMYVGYYKHCPRVQRNIVHNYLFHWHIFTWECWTFFNNAYHLKLGKCDWLKAGLQMVLCKLFLPFFSPLFAVGRGAEGDGWKEFIRKGLVCYICCLDLLLLFAFKAVLHGWCSKNK